jgi:serine/threonine-protein kinase
LAGLGHAHHHGIVHGDVSPANVMLGADDHAKLLDFGGARYLGDPDMGTPDGVVRTLRYMAPEQALGGTVGTAADVYGSGCLLYALLTGRPPFHGNDPIALAYQHVHETPRPPAATRPTIPQQLEDVVLRALAKAPSARHADPETFRLDLLAAVHAARKVAS